MDVSNCSLDVSNWKEDVSNWKEDSANVVSALPFLHPKESGCWDDADFVDGA